MEVTCMLVHVNRRTLGTPVRLLNERKKAETHERSLLGEIRELKSCKFSEKPIAMFKVWYKCFMELENEGQTDTHTHKVL